MEDTGKMNGYVTIESWKLNHRFDQNRKDQGWESLDTSHEMLFVLHASQFTSQKKLIGFILL